MTAAGRARWLYLLLMLWQFLWFAVLPAPWGKTNLALAVVVTLPMLLPLRGVWREQSRALILAGYLMLLYLMLGLVEWWAAPAQRWPATLHVLLVITFGYYLALATRKPPRVKD
jgi:uncharacterized membrane protein